MRLATFSGLVLLSLFAAQASAADRPSNARPLGINSAENTIAYDINAFGQVAAVLEDEEGHQRAVMFDKGKLTELGSLGGMYSDAKGINDNGEIVGSARNSNGSWSAFLYDRARGMRVLGTLGGPSSYGMAVNQDGFAAGFADTENGDWHAFLYNGNEQLKDLGTLGGKISYASGMNNMGQVVGTAATAQEYRHAFIYDAQRGMVDLGTLGGRQSAAMAINDDGVVVGASETRDRRWHAFIHDGKRMVDLGALISGGNSFATGINKAGHVVGTVMSGDERLSFVYRDGKMIVHRGGKGLHLTNNINDAEQVIGATFDRKLIAATMMSDAVPVVARGGTDLMILIISILSAATLGVMGVFYHRRSLGIDIRSLG
jgi:probable HAF family extracellular repeat protein